MDSRESRSRSGGDESPGGGHESSRRRPSFPRPSYDEYAECGESENRNKELKCGLHADRLSDHRFLGEPVPAVPARRRAQPAGAAAANRRRSARTRASVPRRSPARNAAGASAAADSQPPPEALQGGITIEVSIDGDDHDTLRHDPVFQLVCDRLPEDGAELASQPTLSRFEGLVILPALSEFCFSLGCQGVDAESGEPIAKVAGFSERREGVLLAGKSYDVMPDSGKPVEMRSDVDDRLHAKFSERVMRGKFRRCSTNQRDQQVIPIRSSNLRTTSSPASLDNRPAEFSTTTGFRPRKLKRLERSLLDRFAEVLEDDRQQPTHSMLAMVRQRVYGILAGYEDQKPVGGRRSARFRRPRSARSSSTASCRTPN